MAEILPWLSVAMLLVVVAFFVGALISDYLEHRWYRRHFPYLETFQKPWRPW